MSLFNSAPNGIINTDLAKSSVLNAEMRRKSQGSSSQLEVLVIEIRGMSKSRGPKNRDKNINKSNRFANVNCYHWGMKGHIKKHCRKLKRENKEKGKVTQNGDGKNDDRVATTTSGDFFTVYDDDVINFACHETSGVIDSGSSTHVTSRQDFFTFYTTRILG
jgi:hypothetical protein